MYISDPMARTPALATANGISTRATSLYDQLRSDLLDGAPEMHTTAVVDGKGVSA